MAWFLNHYKCARCSTSWSDPWSSTCDDDCTRCGARHMSPEISDDLTVIVEQEGKHFVVLRSPKTAEYAPDYREIGRFTSRRQAARLVKLDRSVF